MPPTPLKPGAPEVIAHLQFLQGLINRMAKNSALCKTLCVTLVAGLAAFAAAAQQINIIMLAAVPTVLFCYLDCLYLSLERSWRDEYNSFVKRLHDGQITAGQAYRIKPAPGYDNIWAIWEAFWSWSVYPVYAPLLGILLLIHHLYS